MSPRTLPSLGRIDSSIVIPSDQVAVVRALVQASRSVPIPETPEALIEEAGRLRERAEWHERMARASRQQAESFEALAGVRVTVAGRTHLNIDGESSTSEVRMEAESAGAGRSSAQFDDSVKDHKFVAMLLRRKITVADVARELAAKLKRKIPARTVQSWYQDVKDDKYRPVPEDAALALKEPPYSVPFSAWARIRKRKAN